ncbi:hypothetical protein TNCV_4526201 [Trichonephila clavipes]|nr:hypothetical protein TNCV_4526201 [Trichonephila clavipes]
MNKIFNSDDIIKSIKLSRMRWVRHIERMSPECTTLKIFNATSSNKRPKGKPKSRWKGCVDEDNAILNVKNWRSIAVRKGRMEKTSEEGSGPQRAVMPMLMN